MKIGFHGAAGTVTGSNHLIETEGGRVLIDCGMFQGPREIRSRNLGRFFYDPATIDAVIVTHAHIDHSGLLPKLVKNGFKGPIYVNHATAELLEVLLHDSAHIQSIDASWENRKRKRRGQDLIEPLYNDEDVNTTLSMIQEIPYHVPFNPLSNIRAVFQDAGHIMGSSFVEMDITENGITKTMIASGDLGRSHQSIINDPEVGDHADIVLMESTYGDRQHKTATDTQKELIAILKEVSQDKGTLLIPAFAVGRTQEMVYRLFELSQEHKLPKIKIFIDSPMAGKVTQIYEENKDLYDDKTTEFVRNGLNPLDQPEFTFTESARESKAINDVPGPKVIISASGMCDAGRIVHHLKHNIWKSNTHLLFVGYQARGTLGRRIIEGAKKVTILGETLQVNAKIHTVGGLSAHADSDEMISWLRFYKQNDPDVFIVHGDPDVSVKFGERIRQDIGLNTHIPDWHDTADLTFNQDSIDIMWHRFTISNDLPQLRKQWLELTKTLTHKLDKFSNVDREEEQLLAEDLLRRMNEQLSVFMEEFDADMRF